MLRGSSKSATSIDPWVFAPKFVPIHWGEVILQYQISWQAIQLLSRYFTLNRSGDFHFIWFRKRDLVCNRRTRRCYSEPLFTKSVTDSAAAGRPTTHTTRSYFYENQSCRINKILKLTQMVYQCCLLLLKSPVSHLKFQVIVSSVWLCGPQQ